MSHPGSMPTLAQDTAVREVTFAQGASYGYGVDLMAPTRRRLYLRYVVAFPPTFDFGPAPGGFKMPGVGERRANGQVPHGCGQAESGWSGRLQADTLGKEARLCGYAYWSLMPKARPTHEVQHTFNGTSPCGTIMRPRAGGLLKAGRWHVVEVESVRNTPCLSDGLYRVSLDGVVVLEDTEARMTDCPMYEAAAIDLFYFGGTNRSPKDQALTVRDLILKGE